MGKYEVKLMASRFCVRVLSGMTSLVPLRFQWRLSPVVDRLASTAFLTPDGPMVVRRGGLLWEVNPHDEICRALLWSGSYESRDMDVVKGCLHEGAVVLDVGANIGIYSIMASKFLRGNCSIYALEPNPPVYQTLCRNIDRNKVAGIVPCKIALGDKKGVEILATCSSNTGVSYVQPEGSRDGGTVIEVTTLNDFVAEKQIKRIDFMKVDVEGYEAMFLKGGLKTLKAMNAVIMIEICPHNLKRMDMTPEGIVALLRECGYTKLTCLTRRGIIPFLPDCFSDGSAIRNVFCSKS